MQSTFPHFYDYNSSNNHSFWRHGIRQARQAVGYCIITHKKHLSEMKGKQYPRLNNVHMNHFPSLSTNITSSFPHANLFPASKFIYTKLVSDLSSFFAVYNALKILYRFSDIANCLFAQKQAIRSVTVVSHRLDHRF